MDADKITKMASYVKASPKNEKLKQLLTQIETIAEPTNDESLKMATVLKVYANFAAGFMIETPSLTREGFESFLQEHEKTLNAFSTQAQSDNNERLKIYREIVVIVRKIFASKESKACFIATASCGIDSEEVKILRDFRDRILLRNFSGRLFVQAYYKISPPIASLIKKSTKTKHAIRNTVVRPLAKYASRKLNIGVGDE